MPARLILVVDDDLRILELVQGELQSAGYLTVAATNGVEGLKKLQSQEPSLVILDVNMPELDGFQTCRMIRADEKHKTLPILMLTAKGDIIDMLEARKMGADDYLVKPFDPPLLIEKVERLFSR